ncbi:ring-cleaving dioxygenase [Salegentibacter salarius]|uniref:Diguanylate cyclase n=1 Tax=Salegentibacter salarius TaxID=435906 RepID=A0A2N0TSU9_9FLAO|nr:ring-cleaving dioxygenase [Salegentibacter salarius]OEY72025.1 diguanylate cyclase [Salegentibacter salarius]PKD17820.1 diguanylate cyclase [Salegentibacter salarius]SLK05271.1 glyoxalase family protein [Salegentibacter salarius]
MEHKILGLHHITAIAGNAQRNYDFYTKTLGLRMVKKTVNFDDPKTYHFYFGDKTGTPGSILTFFPWERVKKGKNGVGMATEIGYSVPEGSLDFWKKRFEKNGVEFGKTREQFGEKYLPFRDPDGLNLKLVVPKHEDDREAWETDEIKSDVALKGFHSVTLTLYNVGPTAGILTDIFDYELEEKEDDFYRYKTSAVENAAIVDIHEDPTAERGINAGGTNHHIAFRVKDEETQMYFREKIIEKGLQITEKIDRDYFFSLYFREPGGVLFEIATDNPGFTRDEDLEELGSSLKLPAQYEGSRDRIEKLLPELKH